MSATTWGRVDDYFVEKLLGADPVQEATLRQNAADGLPAIDVSATQGKLLNLLVTLTGARNILEIGTLGGYSTIWMACALPADGKLITCEYEPRHAATARTNIDRAGFGKMVDIRVGAAKDSLPTIAAEGAGPFDFIFIDADKPSNPIYLDWAVKLSRPGTVIVLDNVVRDGGVIDGKSADPSVIGTRAGIDIISANPRLNATAIQTVGSKGYDGFAIAIVK
jgi:predicted O-methyltransferase YrrM